MRRLRYIMLKKKVTMLEKSLEEFRKKLIFMEHSTLYNERRLYDIRNDIRRDLVYTPESMYDTYERRIKLPKIKK